MRRAPIVITATVLGTAGVLLFKPVDTASVAGPVSGTDDSSSTESSAPSTSPTTGSTPSPSASTSTSTGKASSNGTFTGDPETTRFGTTQVRVTIASGRITAVDTVQLNQNDPRSAQISETAAPMLRTEVLSKQTAAVDMISGATYTSAAYEASLQSALDKAGYSAPDHSKASTDLSNVE